MVVIVIVCTIKEADSPITPSAFISSTSSASIFSFCKKILTFFAPNTIFAVTREARVEGNTESRKAEGGEGHV